MFYSVFFRKAFVVRVAVCVSVIILCFLLRGAIHLLSQGEVHTQTYMIYTRTTAAAAVAAALPSTRARGCFLLCRFEDAQTRSTV